MGIIGVKVYGLRLPIISKGDDLKGEIVKNLEALANTEKIYLGENDIIGVTEAVVAKAQGNYVDIKTIAYDLKVKFPAEEIALVFPILSRNRFFSVLKAVALAFKEVKILLRYPEDEVGNPLVDESKIEDNQLALQSYEEFAKSYGEFQHPLTMINYPQLYQSVGPQVKVYLSSDPLDVLALSKNILVCDIHKREQTKKRLLANGGEKVFGLADIMNESIAGSGFNEKYGLLGSNTADAETVKLFPRLCDEFVGELAELLKETLGVSPQILIYGDGAYKDPGSGIWELADPVVAAAYTDRLASYPKESKLKYLADSLFGDLEPKERQQAVKEFIKNNKGSLADGTTPRRYADLVGSLCDLVSGSGDRGTPVVLIQGYFDDYSSD